jgi:hypothetical protein
MAWGLTPFHHNRNKSCKLRNVLHGTESCEHRHEPSSSIKGRVFAASQGWFSLKESNRKHRHSSRVQRQTPLSLHKAQNCDIRNSHVHASEDGQHDGLGYPQYIAARSLTWNKSITCSSTKYKQTYAYHGVCLGDPEGQTPTDPIPSQYGSFQTNKKSISWKSNCILPSHLRLQFLRTHFQREICYVC